MSSIWENPSFSLHVYLLYPRSHYLESHLFRHILFKQVTSLYFIFESCNCWRSGPFSDPDQLRHLTLLCHGSHTLLGPWASLSLQAPLNLSCFSPSGICLLWILLLIIMENSGNEGRSSQKNPLWKNVTRVRIFQVSEPWPPVPTISAKNL